MRLSVVLRHTLRILACPLIVCVAPVASAGDAGSETVLFFPGPLMPLKAAAHPAVGNKIATTTLAPGMAFAGWEVGGAPVPAGGGWWALVCERQCRLYPTRLSVRDSEPSSAEADSRLLVRSRLLHWSPLPFGLAQVVAPGSATSATGAISESAPSAPSASASSTSASSTSALAPSTGSATSPGAASPGAVLLAIFKPLRPMRFKPGVVPGWLHIGMERYPPPAREDTLEIAIPLPIARPGQPARFAQLVPRALLIRAEPGVGPPIVAPFQIDVLELRVDGKRQALAGYKNTGTQAPDASSILRWAGDLDGDGKLDLILSHDEQDIDGALYLSSLAKPGQLVGLAGSMKYVLPQNGGR